MSIGNWTMLDPAVTGERIFADAWNNEFQNVINNCNPDGVGTASENVSRMQELRDPYPGGQILLAQSTRHELLGLRFQLNGIIGKDYWYEPPSLSLEEVTEGIVTGGDLHDHTGAGPTGGGALIGEDAVADDSIGTDKIKKDAIITNRILDGVVTPEKLSQPIGKVIQFEKTDTPIETRITKHIPLITTPPTPPAFDEGDLIFSLNMTPTAVGNYIIINYGIQFEGSRNEPIIQTIAMDHTVDCLYAAFTNFDEEYSSRSYGTMAGSYIYETTTTVERTFEVRCGMPILGTRADINTIFGSAAYSYMSLTEINMT